MIRFLADADLNHAIVKGCRRHETAMDFLSASGTVAQLVVRSINIAIYKQSACYFEPWREFFRFQASKRRSSLNFSVFFAHDLLPPAYVAEPN
jgi:hypothetical protein